MKVKQQFNTGTALACDAFKIFCQIMLHLLDTGAGQNHCDFACFMPQGSLF